MRKVGSEKSNQNIVIGIVSFWKRTKQREHHHPKRESRLDDLMLITFLSIFLNSGENRPGQGKTWLDDDYNADSSAEKDKVEERTPPPKGNGSLMLATPSVSREKKKKRKITKERSDRQNSA